MRKTIKLLAIALLGMGSMAMQAYDKIGLSFSRTGTDVGSVAVSIVDQDGKAIEGATATLTSSHAFKASAGDINEGILCFDVNGNTSPTINFSVAVSGLKESITYSLVGIDVHALNGASKYQMNSDNVNRFWNVNLKQNGSDFAFLEDIDIAAGIGESGANVHQFWDLEAESEAVATGTLTLDFTITAGSDNKGCFFGLSYITIGGNEVIEQGTEPVDPPVVDPIDPPVDPDEPVVDPDEEGFGGSEQYYRIQWYGNENSYITETNGVLQVDALKNTVMQYWQFLPTGKAHCYYIKNAITKNYIEACKTSADNTYNIGTVPTPVEYYISKESAVDNAYRLTSTNCNNYDATNKAPVGLNKNGANSYIITWGAATANTGSYWYIVPTELDYDYEGAAASKKHSAFAKSAQVYFMPCGSVKSTVCVSKLQVTGEGAMRPLDYPATTWAGSTKKSGTANVSSYWTLFTTDKGEVAPGREIQVAATLRGIPAAGYIAQACFDWNHDGEFEDVQQIDGPTSKNITFKTTVPADAKMGESRMRVRITDNGMTGPDEEVSQGQILDCILVTVPYADPEVTVSVNDTIRGAASKTVGDGGQVTCTAYPVGNAKFLCWLDGKKVLGTLATYTFIPQGPRHLTAVFSINTTDERPTGVNTLPATPVDEPYAVPQYYDLTGRLVASPVKGETYIRKDSALAGKVVIF